MDDRFLHFLRSRVLRCVRERGDEISIAGLSYCAVKDGKSILCFTEWPYETGPNSVDYQNHEIKADGDSWTCGWWKIEFNAVTDGDRHSRDLIALRAYEKNNKTDFDANMALAAKVLEQRIKRSPRDFEE